MDAGQLLTMPDYMQQDGALFAYVAQISCAIFYMFSEDFFLAYFLHESSNKTDYQLLITGN